jgi:putative ABC transport system permease protein
MLPATRAGRHAGDVTFAEGYMAVITTEIRNAARSLSRSPTVTACAILCLTLGIGATTAISSALSRALLQPLPFRNSSELVAVHRVTPQSGPEGTWPQSAPNFVDLARESRTVLGLSAMSYGTAVINLPNEALQASQLYVSGSLFQTLGASAQRGRLLLPDDDRENAPLVAVLSDELWRTRFGADPAVVGSVVSIDGEPTSIVGVLPRDFRIPHGGNVNSADIWMTIRLTPNRLTQRRNNYLWLVGRLAPGASVASADAEMKGHFANLIRQYPDLTSDNVRVAPLHAENVGQVRKPLLLLFGAACMVLLISATNVAALLLARGVQRQRETAVRVAIGASRADLIRQSLIESGIITAVSAVLGLALASAGVKTIGLLAAARIPQLAGLHMDGRVAAMALLLTAIVTLACGAAPAWRNTLVDPQDALRGGRGGGTGKEHHRALRSLVVVEIALSLVLLIGAGLVLKGFASLLDNDPGFDTSRIVTLRVTTSALKYPNQTAVRDFLEPTIAAIRQVPGVEAAAAISSVPYVSWGNNSNVRYEGQPGNNPSQLPMVEQRRITSGFFDVTKQRLVAGRLPDPAVDDRPESPLVVVVNEALVKRDFKGSDPIGKRFHINDTTFVTIVGVVTNIRNAGPINEPLPESYWSYQKVSPGAATVSLMVRVAGGNPTAVMPGVRAAVRSVDPEAAVASVFTMDEVIARSLGQPRFYFSLLGSFAAIAIVLAVAGLYGVLSYAVAQRTREIGIRSALGSTPAAVVRLFAMEGFRLVMIGVVLGIAGGVAVTRLMEFMLYGISPIDAPTWGLATALLVVSGMAAAVIPAIRASRVNPIVAIQTE